MTEAAIEPAGYSNAAHIYYAAFHAQDAALRSASKTQGVLLGLLALAIGGYYFVLPLKTTQTRILEVETATGRTVVSNRTPTAFLEVSDRVMLKAREFFLREFVSAFVTLDARTLKERIPFAASMLQGVRAKNAFEEQLYVIEKIPEKIAQNPGLTREYEHKSISSSSDGKIAFVRFNVIEKINGQQQNVIPKLVTLEYAFVPEESGKEKDLNPLGLRVTYFTVSLDN